MFGQRQRVDLWNVMGLDGRRAIIVHHDDLGITEAQARAQWALGFPTGSVMLPAPRAPLTKASPKPAEPTAPAPATPDEAH